MYMYMYIFASRKRGTRKADATLPTQPLMIPLLQDIIVVFNMFNILILIKSDPNENKNKRLRPDSDWFFLVSAAQISSSALPGAPSSSAPDPQTRSCRWALCHSCPLPPDDKRCRRSFLVETAIKDLINHNGLKSHHSTLLASSCFS